MTAWESEWLDRLTGWFTCQQLDYHCDAPRIISQPRNSEPPIQARPPSESRGGGFASLGCDALEGLLPRRPATRSKTNVSGQDQLQQQSQGSTVPHFFIAGNDTPVEQTRPQTPAGQGCRFAGGDQRHGNIPPMTEVSKPCNFSTLQAMHKQQSQIQALGAKIDELQGELLAEMKCARSQHDDLSATSALVAAQANASMQAACVAAMTAHFVRSGNPGERLTQASTRKSSARSRGSTHRLEEELQKQENDHAEIVEALRRRIERFELNQRSAGTTVATVEREQAASAKRISEHEMATKFKLENDIRNMCRATDELHAPLTDCNEHVWEALVGKAAPLAATQDVGTSPVTALDAAACEYGNGQTEEALAEPNPRISGRTRSHSNTHRLREDFELCERNFEEKIRTLDSQVHQLEAAAAESRARSEEQAVAGPAGQHTLATGAVVSRAALKKSDDGKQMRAASTDSPTTTSLRGHAWTGGRHTMHHLGSTGSCE